MEPHDAQNAADLVAGLFAMGFSLAFVGGFLCLMLAIQAAITGFLWDTLRRIPAEHRAQEPGLVWLLMVPLLNMVWPFFVYPKIAESYQRYFAATGRYDQGDGGMQLATIYCWALVAQLVVSFLGICIGIIPIIGMLFSMVQMVVILGTFALHIVVLVKFGMMRAFLPPLEQPGAIAPGV